MTSLGSLNPHSPGPIGLGVGGRKEAYFAKDYTEEGSITLAEAYRQRTGALGKRKGPGWLVMSEGAPARYVYLLYATRT